MLQRWRFQSLHTIAKFWQCDSTNLIHGFTPTWSLGFWCSTNPQKWASEILKSEIWKLEPHKQCAWLTIQHSRSNLNDEDQNQIKFKFSMNWIESIGKTQQSHDWHDDLIWSVSVNFKSSTRNACNIRSTDIRSISSASDGYSMEHIRDNWQAAMIVVGNLKKSWSGDKTGPKYQAQILIIESSSYFVKTGCFTNIGRPTKSYTRCRPNLGCGSLSWYRSHHIAAPAKPSIQIPWAVSYDVDPKLFLMEV